MYSEQCTVYSVFTFRLVYLYSPIFLVLNTSLLVKIVSTKIPISLIRCQLFSCPSQFCHNMSVPWPATLVRYQSLFPGEPIFSLYFTLHGVRSIYMSIYLLVYCIYMYLFIYLTPGDVTSLTWLSPCPRDEPQSRDEADKKRKRNSSRENSLESLLEASVCVSV